MTLDSDTRLPREAVRRLIGKIAHPLNRPRFDRERGAVVEGYGVLQPRVTPSLPKGGEGSLFQRVFSSSSGIDPYSSAVSDVYQDMFGEGSYAGKGIYDIDAFEAALAGRAPDATLLSHDLFEGTFARAGFASDVEVVEEFPTRYDVSASRHHRWARGDWQLLPWILGFAGKGRGREPGRNALPRIGRWKMIDNLRRTLTAPTAVLALALGWTLPLPSALAWTAFVLATILVPNLIPVISALPVAATRRFDLQSRPRARRGLAAGRDFVGVERRVSRRSGLDAERRHRADAVAAFRQPPPFARMDAGGAGDGRQAARSRRLRVAHDRRARRRGGGPVRRAAVRARRVARGRALRRALAGFARGRAMDQPAAGARKASRDLRRRGPRLAPDARRTWRYFETFVTPADNWLPPDNFQEDPAPVVAHRTSPTNIGLYLLSVVAARDFGWIGATQAIERLEATHATMARMARFRGHFFNWYDTRDLRVLAPAYVSSVDSGNLAGHLIALANACREWRGSSPDATSRRAGVGDMIALLSEEAARLRAGLRTQTVTPRQLEDSLAAMSKTLAQTPLDEAAMSAKWAQLAKEGAESHRHRQRHRAREPRRTGVGSALLVARDPDGDRRTSRGPRVLRR